MQKEETGDINYILGYRHFLPRAAFRASVSLCARSAGRGTWTRDSTVTGRMLTQLSFFEPNQQHCLCLHFMLLYFILLLIYYCKVTLRVFKEAINKMYYYYYQTILTAWLHQTHLKNRICMTNDDVITKESILVQLSELL